jgi:hypothetical protein
MNSVPKNMPVNQGYNQRRVTVLEPKYVAFYRIAIKKLTPFLEFQEGRLWLALITIVSTLKLKKAALC